MNPFRGALILFFAFLALYLGGMPGALAPYRDAGEMVSAAHTLSVAHPPGYPSYVLLGRIFEAVPLGSAAYRLNLLSAAFGAGAVALFFWVLAPRLGVFSALAGALLLGSGATFIHSAQVSEMYSIHALNAVVMLFLSWKFRETGEARWFFLQGLYFGVALGIRMDLLLMGPALAWLALDPIRKLKKNQVLPVLIYGTLAFLFGLTAFLYLPIRAVAEPVINWNDPSNLENFLSSVLRKKYGSTLDLLSKNFNFGELFLVNLKLYAEHCMAFLTPLGLLAALAGFVEAWRQKPSLGTGLLLAFLFPGPIFLLLANMPPNPHALAIVEAHYVLPDVLLAVAAVFGFKALLDRAPAAPALGAGLVLLGGFQTATAVTPNSRRWNLFAHDYALNALRLTPPHGAIVAREDVQLFSLWHHQTVLGRRPDVKIVPQGLAGSRWFARQQAKRWPGFRLVRLSDNKEEAWRVFLGQNSGPILASHDANLPQSLRPVPRALLSSLRPSPAPVAESELEAPWAFVATRGTYDYGEQNDFFSSDLIELYSQARHAQAAYLFHSGRRPPSKSLFLLAHAYKPISPEQPLYLGSISSGAGDWEDAERRFARSSRLFESMLERAVYYRTLPGVVEGISRTASTSFLNWGVSAEKRGDKAAAERRYRRAIELNPKLADAWFNLSVLYWNRDPRKVVEFLKAALRADPGHARARQYLQKFAPRQKS